MRGVLLAGAFILVCGSAHAIEIDIAAGPNGWGCTTCYNGPYNSDVAPGTVVTLDNQGETGPLQTTLGAGTYVITNAQTTGTYSGWNYQGYPDTPNWVWSYIIGSDNGNGTATILQTGYINATEPTQAQIAALTNTPTYSYNTLLSATSTATFTNTLTLASTTVLDFFIDDGYLPDNGGGVALNIVPEVITPPPPVPPSTVSEPASLAVLGMALAGLLFGRRFARSG